MHELINDFIIYIIPFLNNCYMTGILAIFPGPPPLFFFLPRIALPPLPFFPLGPCAFGFSNRKQSRTTTKQVCACVCACVWSPAPASGYVHLRACVTWSTHRTCCSCCAVCDGRGQDFEDQIPLPQVSSLFENVLAFFSLCVRVLCP